MSGDLAAMRAAGGIQLAALDGRDGDITVITAGLDAAQLRAVIAELVSIWRDSTEYSCDHDELRQAVALDALAQAAMDGRP